jgi:hypothetical protein
MSPPSGPPPALDGRPSADRGFATRREQPRAACQAEEPDTKTGPGSRAPVCLAVAAGCDHDAGLDQQLDQTARPLLPDRVPDLASDRLEGAFGQREGLGVAAVSPSTKKMSKYIKGDLTIAVMKLSLLLRGWAQVDDPPASDLAEDTDQRWAHRLGSW